MPILRVYVDTSVFGGFFDDEFSDASRLFFDRVRAGRIAAVVSNLVLEELEGAPQQVRELMRSLPRKVVLRVRVTEEALELRNAYLSAGVLGLSAAADATHVAMATVNRVDAIVSWNFKHIVHVEKIRAFNQVNLAAGYGLVTILSPEDVRPDDES